MNPIEKLIVICKNEALMAKDSAERWKGKNELIYHASETRQSTYERICDYLINIDLLDNVDVSDLPQKIELPTFFTRDELHHFIERNIPVAHKSDRTNKFLDVFTSRKAQDVVVDSLVELLIKNK